MSIGAKTKDIVEFHASALDVFLQDWADCASACEADPTNLAKRTKFVTASSRLTMVSQCMYSFFSGCVEGAVSSESDIAEANQSAQVAHDMYLKRMRDFAGKEELSAIDAAWSEPDGDDSANSPVTARGAGLN